MSDQMPPWTWLKRVLLRPFGKLREGEYVGFWCPHLHWDSEKREYMFNHYCYAQGFNVCPSCEANRPRSGEGRWGKQDEA